jgi:hypothetical protein
VRNSGAELIVDFAAWPGPTGTAAPGHVPKCSVGANLVRNAFEGCHRCQAIFLEGHWADSPASSDAGDVRNPVSGAGLTALPRRAVHGENGRSEWSVEPRPLPACQPITSVSRGASHADETTVMQGAGPLAHRLRPDSSHNIGRLGWG